MKFAEKFKNDSVTLGGYTIPITIESISQIIGLPMIGEDLLQRDHYANLLSKFHPENETHAKIYITVGHIQGVKGKTLPAKWANVAKWIMQYLTYEGQHSSLTGHHLKLLIYLRYDSYTSYNISKFLFQSLHKMARKVRDTKKDKLAILKHHGLVTLLCREYLL